MDLINETGCCPGWFWSIVPPKGSPTAPTGTFLLKGTYRLTPGAAAQLLTEEDGDPDLPDGDQYCEDDEANGLIYPSDLVWFKPHADLLLHGTCHTPAAKPLQVCNVEFTVGPHTRKLAVIGDRFWRTALLGKGMSEATPFNRMPLHWGHAFGGDGFDQNPVGRGHGPLADEDGEPFHPLPNVEDPAALITSARNKPDPAGFGPYPQLWPQRYGKMGTFGKDYEENYWPGFPGDFDWTFFNAAPIPQQIPGYLRGDETLRMVNLHPDHPVYESQLPAVRPRWFVRDRVPAETPAADADDERAGKPDEGEIRFREIPLHLDTLWVDMERERLVLVWRGVIPVQSRKLKGMVESWIVNESLASEPTPAAAYEQRWDERKLELDPEEEIEPIEGVEPIPPGDIDPDVVIGKAMKELQKEMAEVKKLIANGEKRALAITKGLDPKYLKPPKAAGGSNPAGQLAGVAKALKALGKKPPKLPDASKLGKAAAVAKFDKLEADLEASVAANAPPESDLEHAEPEDDWTRDTVAEHAEDGGSFDGEDLEGLDLSGLDFSGLSFREANLTRANLAGCGFSNADLSMAVLTDAVLTVARLEGSNLTGADLAGARLTSAKLAGANLHEADLSGARFTEADLRKATLTACVATGADFTRITARESDWSSADLAEAILEGADLTAARMVEASVAGGRCAGVILNDADLTKFRAGDGADLTDGQFKGVAAPDSVWDGSILDRTLFFEADLTNADFEDASLCKANLSRAFLRTARFCEARMDGVQLIQSDMFEATLEGASLHDANFHGANLFGVEFYEADVAGAVFTDANIKRTRLAR